MRSNATPIPSSIRVRNIRAVITLLLPFFLTLTMAVDRSKFRTCQQTSFCRRHRHGKSRQLYDYSLVNDSVRILRDDDRDAFNIGDAIDGVTTNGAGGGLLSKFSRKLLLGNHEERGNDPHVRGPSPILMAKLVNIAPFTSTALTARAYGKKCVDSGNIIEELNLAVHLHKDGVARLRITEVLEEGSEVKKGPRSVPRWTSDSLVLNEREMKRIADVDVRVVCVNPSIQQALSLPGRERFSGEIPEEIISSLMKRANIADQLKENMIVLSYGPPEQQWHLMLQLHPFAVYFFRGNDETDPPMIVGGTGGLTYFEVRRNKDCVSGGDGDSLRQLGDYDVDFGEYKSDDSDDEEDNRHRGKEIVGYWEDGLAIYADGTREERREFVETSPANHNAPDDGKLWVQRRLYEDSFDTKDMWEEKYGDHTDTKPHGPMSVGMELTFPASNHLFGLPEHASSTQLKTTTGSNHHYAEPYRLYNLDVFEYELNETMALYGHVPLVISQSIVTETSGVFWFNPTETFVDVAEVNGSSKTYFMSESGIIDLFLLPGPNPSAIYNQYARLTGRTPLPPIFALGYHQCRWNYRDEADIYSVHSNFEDLDYPYDVLWLDIEHTDGKRYFTWNDKAFPNPIEMQKKLGGHGHRTVTIIDPHIKRDMNYYIHKEATSLGLYVKEKNGETDFDGWCWPGSSSYLDFTTEKVRSWWAEQFQYKKYKGSTPELFTWNDMNEPSVFNGPEVSMQKDLLNLNNCEHREWHNLYGMLFQRSTSEGLLRRNEGENIRPFVLSRSFFAGSQRYGAIWTGDNEAKWSHLEISAPMLLGLNVGALSFVGADVGGFFGDTDAELMTRWMQAGAYQPFFRGHAHHDAKRREPWMFGDETMARLRRAAMTRYALLPYWYTVFWKAGVTGMPVMRTMWMQYPKLPDFYSVDDQYLIGSDLLVKPVTSPGAIESMIHFPSSESWYDVDTMKRVELATTQSVSVDSDIDKIPVFQRGGSIIPRKLRLRRSSHLMSNDPYTLFVALGYDLKANGQLYIDDETTFDNKKRQAFGVASFHSSWFDNIAIQNSVYIGNSDLMNHAAMRGKMVERIVVVGVPTAPREIRSKYDNSPQEFQYDVSSNIIVIRKPGLSALEDFSLYLIQ